MNPHAQYDPTMLSDDLILALTKAEAIATTLGRMLPHITAAFPGYIEAVQHGMRPGVSQGTAGVHTSDVSDRTFAEVARRSKGHDELTEIAALAAEAIGTVRQLERRLTSRRREADEYEVEQVRKAIRCSGDPTCHANAVHDGLCARCRAAGWPSATEQRKGGLRGSDGRTGARPPYDRLAGIGERASLGNLQDRLDARAQIGDVA